MSKPITKIDPRTEEQIRTLYVDQRLGATEISKRLDLPRPRVRKQLTLMAQVGSIELRGAHGAAQEPDPRARKRECLSCQDPFVSAHAGNRICSECKNSDHYKGMDMSSTVVASNGGRVSTGRPDY